MLQVGKPPEHEYTHLAHLYVSLMLLMCIHAICACITHLWTCNECALDIFIVAKHVWVACSHAAVVAVHDHLVQLNDNDRASTVMTGHAVRLTALQQAGKCALLVCRMSVQDISLVAG